jgi:glycosyltransferase involved in cell wall biosynthesis
MLRKPVVWTPHGAFQHWKGVKRKRAKRAWEKLCRFVAPGKLVIHTASEQEAQTALNRFPDARVVNIPHGIVIPQEVAHKDVKGILRLLYIGRLHPIKGIEQLLDACKILKCEFEKSWTLTIAGVGAPDYTRLLETRIRNLGLWQEVKLVGEVVGNAKQGLFSNIDVAVVPSLTESFSLVVAEALAHGVPVIASTGTPWRCLERMKCGLWVHNDPETLAKAIQRMSALPLRKMGSIGREWMEKEFTWERRTQEMIRCYERLIG